MSMATMTAFLGTTPILERENELNRQDESPLRSYLAQTSQAWHFFKARPPPPRKPNKCFRVTVVQYDYAQAGTPLACKILKICDISLEIITKIYHQMIVTLVIGLDWGVTNMYEGLHICHLATSRAKLVVYLSRWLPSGQKDSILWKNYLRNK